MPISGLVLTISDVPSLQQIALEQLASDPRLTLGEIHGNRLPVVAETETVRQGTDLVREELLDIPGVVFVDVVSVDFSDIDDSAEPQEHEQKRPRETRNEQPYKNFAPHIHAPPRSTDSLLDEPISKRDVAHG